MRRWGGSAGGERRSSCDYRCHGMSGVVLICLAGVRLGRRVFNRKMASNSGMKGEGWVFWSDGFVNSPLDVVIRGRLWDADSLTGR
jgi:hypothetical protein